MDKPPEWKQDFPTFHKQYGKVLTNVKQSKAIPLTKKRNIFKIMKDLEESFDLTEKLSIFHKDKMLEEYQQYQAQKTKFAQLSATDYSSRKETKKETNPLEKIHFMKAKYAFEPQDMVWNTSELIKAALEKDKAKAKEKEKETTPNDQSTTKNLPSSSTDSSSSPNPAVPLKNPLLANKKETLSSPVRARPQSAVLPFKKCKEDSRTRIDTPETPKKAFSVTFSSRCSSALSTSRGEKKGFDQNLFSKTLDSIISRHRITNYSGTSPSHNNNNNNKEKDQQPEFKYTTPSPRNFTNLSNISPNSSFRSSSNSSMRLQRPQSAKPSIPSSSVQRNKSKTKLLNEEENNIEEENNNEENLNINDILPESPNSPSSIFNASFGKFN